MSAYPPSECAVSRKTYSQRRCITEIKTNLKNIQCAQIVCRVRYFFKVYGNLYSTNFLGIELSAVEWLYKGHPHSYGKRLVHSYCLCSVKFIQNTLVLIPLLRSCYCNFCLKKFAWEDILVWCAGRSSCMNLGFVWGNSHGRMNIGAIYSGGRFLVPPKMNVWKLLQSRIKNSSQKRYMLGTILSGYYVKKKNTAMLAVCLWQAAVYCTSEIKLCLCVWNKVHANWSCENFWECKMFKETQQS